MESKRHQKINVFLDRFLEASGNIDGTAGGLRRGCGGAAVARASATTSSYEASEDMVSGVPRMCISTAGTPSAAIVGSMCGSCVPPLTSLTQCAPRATSSRATTLELVSTW